MDNQRDEQPENEDVRSPYNFSSVVPETPATDGETRESIGTVEPWEEGERARGFQNGGWDYKTSTEAVGGADTESTGSSETD